MDIWTLLQADTQMLKSLKSPDSDASSVELAWRSGNMMDYHAAARGSIPGWNGVFIKLHVLRKRQ